MNILKIAICLKWCAQLSSTIMRKMKEFIKVILEQSPKNNIFDSFRVIKNYKPFLGKRCVYFETYSVLSSWKNQENPCSSFWEKTTTNCLLTTNYRSHFTGPYLTKGLGSKNHSNKRKRDFNLYWIRLYSWPNQLCSLWKWWQLSVFNWFYTNYSY